MSIMTSDACLPLFEKVLSSLLHVLAKADSHEQAQRIETGVLLQARLFPGVFPLKGQVQFNGDFAKGAAARMSGVDMPRVADDEQAFAPFQDRLARTLTVIRSADRAEIDGSKDPVIAFELAGQPLRFKAVAYLLGWPSRACCST